MFVFVTTFLRRLFWYALLSTVFLALVLWGLLALVPEQQPPARHEVILAPPTLTTNTWGLFDVTSGELLTGSNTDTVRPIASVTKLFTAEAVIRSTKKDAQLTILQSDVAEEGRAGKLTSGERTTPYALLYPLLLESSNDAAHAITRTLGSEYDTTVTFLIDSLALSHTTIRDGSGISPQNVSTVRELARYYAHLKQVEPHILDITHLPMFITETDGYLNNNPARAYQEFVAGKHGLTDEAGRTFLGSFARSKNGDEVGMVLLGSANLRADIDALLAYARQTAADSAIIPTHYDTNTQ